MTLTQTSNPKSKKLGLAQRLLLVQGVLLLMIVILEISFRLIGYDFDRQAEAFQRTPVFLRDPTVPVGEAFFRRPGPDQWRGKTLSTHMKEMGYVGDYPADDPEVVLEYDGQGFRNPPDLTDWEIAIAGDSMTELAAVPTADLFTTRLGQELGLRVKNLGVARTGTLAQTCYLQEFGKSPSTRHAVVVFFEGNDLEDLIEENKLLWRARMGQKEERSPESLPRQSSFVKAVYKMLTASPPKQPAYNAHFEFDGRRVPIRLSYAPPGSDRLPSGVRAMLVESLRGWAAAARRLQLKPWLAYMPCKERVLHGHLRFLPNAQRLVIDWTPTDLPEVVRTICEECNIPVIDLGPRLTAETARGNLTFNTSDTHLNRAGSACVAEVLAEAFRKDLQARRASSAEAGRGAVFLLGRRPI